MIFAVNFLIDFFFIAFPVLFIARNAKKFGIKKILAELGLQKIGAKTFFKETTKLTGLLFAVSIAVSIILLAIGLNDTQKVFEAINSLQAKGILFLFYLLIVRVTAEEIFFRGFLAKKTGIIISSTVFALAHISYASAAEIIGAFFLGIVLARAFLKNKNLVPNIFAHIFYNFIVLIIAFSVRM
ncbi:MAG: CPBP family intramembrane metalloprotease [Candidatus ainarchaeum sp.]|nr:CPBP family intramembrane metalloprotease [Candidatus ainarchaeum sp.]